MCIRDSSKTPEEIAPTQPKNKLTQCFDDILKISSEMLLQQQLKTIQLDSKVSNGFNASQQRSLKEKINLFHGILDDLEISIAKSFDYVDTIVEISNEKLIKKKELQRKEEEAAAAAAAAAAEAQARADELKKQQDGQLNDDQNMLSDMKMDFPEDNENDLLSTFNPEPINVDIPCLLYTSRCV